MTGSANDTSRSFHKGGAPVDGELSFTVEDHEHFLNGIVKVMSDARPGWNLAAMQEIEFRRHRAPVQQCGERHCARTAVHCRR
jgi:hypothetical protein